MKDGDYHQQPVKLRALALQQLCERTLLSIGEDVSAKYENLTEMVNEGGVEPWVPHPTVTPHPIASYSHPPPPSVPQVKEENKEERAKKAEVNKAEREAKALAKAAKEKVSEAWSQLLDAESALAAAKTKLNQATLQQAGVDEARDEVTGRDSDTAHGATAPRLLLPLLTTPLHFPPSGRREEGGRREGAREAREGEGAQGGG